MKQNRRPWSLPSLSSYRELMIHDKTVICSTSLLKVRRETQKISDNLCTSTGYLALVSRPSSMVWQLLISYPCSFDCYMTQTPGQTNFKDAGREYFSNKCI